MSELDHEMRALITKQIRAEYEAESAKHTPSGKLSASQLGKPLLEQVLKVIGVPGGDVDDYALGLFKRGNSVEDAIVALLEPDETQKEVHYRNCIGIIDAIKDGKLIEIKSMKNSAIPYIDPENKKRPGTFASYSGVKLAHALQGTFYALAEDKDEFYILYASADDLRTYPHLVKTSDYAEQVDSIITEVEEAIKSKRLPIWKPREEWQEKYPQYSSYPGWMTLSEDGLMEKLKNSYPDVYKRFTK